MITIQENSNVWLKNWQATVGIQLERVYDTPTHLSDAFLNTALDRIGFPHHRLDHLASPEHVP